MIAKRIPTVALIALAISCTCVRANPDSPTIVNGSASFSQPNANTLNVTTHTNKAIINWQGFNIGAGQTTNFIQPNRNSAVLNRVLSNNPSQIYGNLNSNGKVFLINQHGLMIGAGAKINTAGFYGSTLNITNEDFLKGNLKFEGGGMGGIVNRGYIHAGPGGNVVLIAPDIENGGVIEVDNGKVILAAGESIRITSLNDSLIEFDVKSNDDNSIINLGDIVANQGAAQLFAGSLKHSGSINATGLVQNADGSISLVAQADIEVAAGATLNANGDAGGNITVQSDHGDVYFEGRASAQGESGHGGHIEILGDRVGLFGNASVDASGKTGGGEVLIGGDFQGRGDTQTATQTQVGPQASIHADAIDSGDGGKVIVWADAFTLFQGEATATAGAESGDGGFIEISGKGNLGYDGSVDASAVNGAAGTVLFDPIDVTVELAGLTVLPANPLTFLTNPGQLLSIAPIAITAITDTGSNVIIQADRDITITDAITTAEGGAGGDITLQAGQSILINANITTDNGTLKLYANSLGADLTNRGSGSAQITQQLGTNIDAGSGNVEFWMNSSAGGTAGNIDIADVKANHVLIKHNGLDNGGSILQSGGGTITASSVFIDHDGPTNGSVGSPDPPLNVLADFIGAHIHEPTILGIYINAQPLNTSIVTVGNTCYGNGDPGCATFGSHLVGGLETINGGGSINLDVIGDLLAVEPIQVDDVFGTGNPGNILINSSGPIIANSDIINFIPGGNIDLTFSSAVAVFNAASVGINGGTITLNDGGGLGSGPLALNSGTFLEGVGVIDGDVFSQGGVIDIGGALGSVGTLTISGNLSLDTSSIVVFDIVGSAVPGTDYDQLVVNGASGAQVFGDLVALWDTLTPPAAPAIYTLIDAPNGLSGSFSTVVGPVGSTFTPVYNATNFQLNISAVAPVVFWTGQGDGSTWELGPNWSTGTTPDNEFVDINFDGPIVVTISSAVPSILGISTQNELSIQGNGQLSVTDPATSLIGDLLSIDSSGGLSFDGDVYMAGQTSWKSGTLGGNGLVTIASIGGLELNNPGGSVDIKLTNKGTISKIDAGVATLAGTIDNFGTILVNNGTLAYLGALNEGIIDVAAGASLTTTNADLNNLPGATIGGSGTIDVGTGTLFNDGTLEPGGVDSIGILTILGNLTLSSSADLRIDVDNTGLVPGIDYDQLVIDGVTATGTLDGAVFVSLVNGDPVAGAYTLVDTVNGATLANSFGFPSLPAGFTPLVYDGASAQVSFGSGVFWDDGGVAGDWFDPFNWSADLVPTSTDDVTISGADLVINIAGAADANTLSLASGYTLDINVSGSLTIASSAQFDGDLSVSGGILTGNGAITVNGNLNWTGGSIAGSGQLTTNATSTLNQGAGLTISRDWLNTGTVNWQVGNIALNSGRTFINTGIFNANAGAFFTVNAGAQTFDNQNVLNVNSNTTFGGGGSFNNSGSLVIASAQTLSIRTGLGIDTGSWDVGDGAIEISGGARSLNDGFSLSSTTGSLTISSGALNVNTTIVLTLPASLTLDLSGGTLNLTNALTINGNLNWTSVANSTIDGGGTGSLAIIGALNITGNNFHSFRGITVNNFGVTSYLATGGTAALRLNGGTTFNNYGLFDIQDNLLVGNISGAAVFNNQAGGELRKSGGTAAATIVAGVAYTNSAASINIQSGSLTVNGGASLTLDSASVLQGSGTYIGDLVNNGTIRPGGALTTGTLSVNGVFTNTGTIEIEIDNIAGGPGSGYDALAIIGGNLANLGGNLNLISINGYSVLNGDALTPVSYGSRSGAFTVTAIGSEIISPTYNAGSLDLVLNLSGLFSFTGGGDGSTWNDAANWNQGLPGIANDVSIGNFNVTIADNASANTLSLASTGSLNLSGGVLTIAGNSTLDGPVTMSGGDLDIGGVTLTLNGGFNWTGPGFIFGGGSGILNLPAANTIAGVGSQGVDAVIVNISGNTTYSAGSLELYNGGGDPIINNSGIFDFAGDVSIANFTDGGSPGFNNLDGGTILKSAGTRTSTIDVMPGNSNQGSVIVQSGTLDPGLATWTLGAGDTFAGSGTYVGSVINNGGIVRPGGVGSIGVLAITGNYTQNGGLLEAEVQSGGTVAGIDFDQLSISGTGSWTSTTAPLNIAFINAYLPTTGDIHTLVTCAVCGIGIDMGPVTNPSGVTYGFLNNGTSLDATINSVSFFWDGGGDGINWTDQLNWSLDLLPNTGTDVLLTSGQNVTLADPLGLALPIANLTLNSGSSLNLSSGTLTNVGILNVNAGASLGINGGDLVNNGIATFNGNFGHSNGNAAFNAAAVFNAGYSQSGGTETFADTVDFNGSMVHSGGVAIFNGLTNMPGSVNISAGALVLNAVTTLQNLNNTWSGGTISGGTGQSLVLGVSPGDTTLAINGAASKILDTISLDMNLNDINMSGNGSLLLANNATIDNTGGRSFNHSGNGSIAGVGSFVNNGGTFNKSAGLATLSVDLINDASSFVNVAAGTLIIDDAEANDNASYNVGDTGVLVFAQDRSLGGSLNLNGSVIAGLGATTTTLTLPTNLSNQGALLLNNAVLDLSNVAGNTLVMNGGTLLGGSGTVQGNVNNVAGVVTIGGSGNLGDLVITGTYTQGANSAVVVEVLNNGVNTLSDLLTVNGATQLNGGTLLIGFVTNSLGLVTGDFQPFNFSGGASGKFSRVIDAGGNILLINFNGGVFTILGASPDIPDRVIDDLISFLEGSDELNDTIASNLSAAETMMEELLEESEPGSLICN